ncbi:hypothetical protein LCGC14_2800440, partial [marine sediment metagenome]
ACMYQEFFLITKGSFRLKRFRVGVRAETGTIRGQELDKFNGSIIVRFFADIKEPNDRTGVGTTDRLQGGGNRNRLYIDSIFSDADQLFQVEARYEGSVLQDARHTGANWLEFNFSDESDPTDPYPLKQAIYIPGGNRVHAFDLQVTRATGAEDVRIYGAAGGLYEDGRMWEHEYSGGRSWDLNADIGFEFDAFGFESTGTAVYRLDLGEAPASGTSGELVLKYYEPSDSSLSFRFR